MKKHNLYTGIEHARENKKHRDRRPYLNFHKKSDRAFRLLKKIWNADIPNTLFHEAMCQFVIADITAFEVYFKDIFFTIFQYHKNPKELILRFNDKKIVDQTFDLEDLVKVSIENYSIPEIILQFQNFQRLDQLKDVFTRITGKDFFSALKNRKFHQGIESEFEMNADCIPKLQEYLDLRHSIVHDWNPKSDLSIKKISSLHDNLLMFVTAADQYLEWEYLSENLNDSVNREKRKSKLKK